MEKDIRLNNDSEARSLLGKHDENMKLIEKSFGIDSVLRSGILRLTGEDDNVEKAARVIEELLIIIREGVLIKKHDLSYAVKAIREDKKLKLHDIYLERIEVSSKRLYVTPKSKGQKAYVDAIRKHDIVFCIGPAGTGKTYLAMAMAVNALKKKIVSRIILARPAVEAGESLGYLPGDLHDKVGPYLKPMYDALYDMVESDMIHDYLQRGIIEVVPLAYMRGRTLNDSFIILDEAQNSTPEQMKMFLTRLGFDSKTVITGDITQSDLPKGRTSGLVEAQSILDGIEGIKFVYLKGEDVVRHELVQEIIKAYAVSKK
ncbi:MAG: PhoH family protein [Candidatus Omnitrophica bacterium]|nr:PhoH family protein [Candidatus Omnitrophota bacterium]